MDSGNSGSMSSSGGDEEYDSRAESISPFLNPSAHITLNPPPSLSHPPAFFDHPSHNHHLDAFSHSPPNPNANPLYNLDSVWSRNLRSETNYSTDFGNQPLLGVQGLSQGPFPSSSSMPLRSVDGNASAGAPAPHSDQSNVTKNPKKRTRASRRAPTTVLTTDTTNFRQMVQEFTGIPAAPFSASPYSRRLDLFGSGSAVRSAHIDTLAPFYPLRPSAQKQVQLSPYSLSTTSSPSFLNSSMVDAIACTTHIPTATNNIITTSILGNYPTPSDLGLSKQSQNMFNIQNPMLSFQSLLQSPQVKHPLANTPIFRTKSQGSSRVPSLDELGMRQERVNDGGREQNVSGYNLQSSASASGFQPEKGLENVSSRGEGTVDSWICPSD